MGEPQESKDTATCNFELGSVAETIKWLQEITIELHGLLPNTPAIEIKVLWLLCVKQGRLAPSGMFSYPEQRCNTKHCHFRVHIPFEVLENP